jgi:hypothetical protein
MEHLSVRALQDHSLTAVAMVASPKEVAKGAREVESRLLPFHRNYEVNGIEQQAEIQSALDSTVAVAALKRVSNPGRNAARGCTSALSLAAGVSTPSSSMEPSDSQLHPLLTGLGMA